MARPVQEVRDELARVDCEASDRHTRELAGLLIAREAVRFALFGLEKHGDFMESSTFWTLAVITDVRAIRISAYHKEGWATPADVNSVYWVDATGIGPGIQSYENGAQVYTTGSSGGSLIFSYVKPTFFGGNQPTVPPARVEQFRQVAGDLLASVKAATSSGQTTHAPARSLIDELERLGNLKKRGLLTDVEFEAAKHKLLS